MIIILAFDFGSVMPTLLIFFHLSLCISVYLSEAVTQRCSVKNVFSEISQSSQENTSAKVSFLIKLQAEAWNFVKKETLAQAWNFVKKETLAQVFSCEFCEISKNVFSYRTPPVIASDVRW